MGSFSWLKADKLTKVANVAYGKPFKMLIPKEFGGGYIKDKYQDYGYLGTKDDGSPKYDMYEILAFWNANMRYRGEGKVRDALQYDGIFPMMKQIDEYTDHNRGIGINIGCYDYQIDKLNFPLKLVSSSYTGSYEDCAGKSYNDPVQGFYVLTREKYESDRY